MYWLLTEIDGVEVPLGFVAAAAEKFWTRKNVTIKSGIKIHFILSFYYNPTFIPTVQLNMVQKDAIDFALLKTVVLNND